ncbi:MAG: hypothetical protein ACD_20C00337G0014 [uncultured bacterium]|nr:MAG: hypothetical protein ACD_20C00337G0014 [uncultured bacterium]HBH18543.1 hypothetical protein [Cyanobacteria bacterium UBA9579]
MDIKKSSKVPDGVGRKIIEALKKQSEAPQMQEQSSFNEEYNNPVQDFNSIENSAGPDDILWKSEDHTELYEENTSSGYELDDFSLNSDEEDTTAESLDSQLDNEYSYQYNEETSIQEPEEQYGLYTDNEFSLEDIEEPVFEEEPILYEEPAPKPIYKAPSRPPIRKEEPQRSRINRSYIEDDFELPGQKAQELNSGTNIEILMRLISRLPSGVTRQTGAQIIRQTMEAMGISTTKVLTEAQQLQDELAQSIRDDINTIEEYRNNIRSLEKEVQSYKKQSEELEDLIGLFVTSDKNPKRPLQ